VVILPLVAVVLGQATGLLWLGLPLVLLGALVLLLLDVALLAAGTALFDRETILTRWR
jgi:hypothetical protein